MMRRIVPAGLLLLASSLALGTLGCVPRVTPLAGAAGQLEAPAAVGRGEVRVSVHWPERVQTLPLSAETLELSLLKDNTPVATASIARPAVTATFERIPVGAYMLSGQALRADRTLAAQATASVEVLPSGVAQAKLTLVPATPPRLDFLIPAAGRAEQAIYLYGSNLLPPPGGAYSLLVDGQAVPPSLVQRGDSSAVLLGLPSWAGATCSIALAVDGMTTASRTFTRVDHLALVPASASMAPNASLKLTAIAYPYATGTATVSVPLVFSLEDALPDPGNFTLSSDGILQTQGSTGSVTIRVALGDLVATTSVTVD